MIKGIVAIGLFVPTLAFAQVTNGDFSAGPASWTWKKAVSEYYLPCEPVTYSAGAGRPKIWGVYL